MTVQTTVSLPSCFAGILDCSDMAGEQSDFRQFMYPLVWIKKGHVATNVPQDLPCLLSSFISLHSATLAFSPSFQRAKVFFPTPGPSHRIFLLPGMLYLLFLIKLPLLVPRLKVTSSEKTGLSIIKLASIILSNDRLDYNIMRFSLFSVSLLDYKLHENRDFVYSVHHCMTHA